MNTECLQSLVGITRQDCPCNGLTVQSVDTGVYLDEQPYISSYILKSLQDCGTVSKIDIAIKNAINTFPTDFLKYFNETHKANLAGSYVVGFNPYKNPTPFTASKKGFYLYNDGSEALYFTPKNLRFLYEVADNSGFEVFAKLNEEAPVYLGTTMLRGSFYDLSSDKKFTINPNDVLYIYTEDVDVIAYNNNDCGCTPPPNHLINLFKMGLLNSNSFEIVDMNCKFALGVGVEAIISCGYTQFLCEKIQNDELFKGLVADLLAKKAILNVFSFLIADNSPDIEIEFGKERLMGYMNAYNKFINEGTSSLISNFTVNNKCYSCKTGIRVSSIAG